MTAWTNDELRRSGRRTNWRSRPPTRRHAAQPGDDLGRPSRRRPLRPIRQRAHSAWFRGAQVRHEGRLGWRRRENVLLVETDDLNGEIDAAYRAKYRRYAASIVNSTLTPQARAATLKLVPRS